MAGNNHINDPISHCKNGQGGRTFSLLKPGGKKHAPPGVAPNEAHRRGLRQKVQPKPTGPARFPLGKYFSATTGERIG